MITERITLPNGTVIEFFASDLEQARYIMPERYRLEKAKQKQADLKRQRAKKTALKQQKQARRRAKCKNNVCNYAGGSFRPFIKIEKKK